MKFFMCFWKFCKFFHTNQSLQPYKQPSNDILEYTELLKAKNFREFVWSEIEASQSFSKFLWNISFFKYKTLYEASNVFKNRTNFQKLSLNMTYMMNWWFCFCNFKAFYSMIEKFNDHEVKNHFSYERFWRFLWL